MSVRLPDGEYKIVSVLNGKVLEVEGEKANDGTRVVQWQDNDKPHQRWRLTRVAEEHGDVFYTIGHPNSSMVMEAPGPWEQGDPVVMRLYAPDGDQRHRQWKLDPVAGKTDVYEIVNRQSGLCIDVKDCDPKPEAIKQYASWDPGDDRQHWKLIPIPAPVTPTATPTPTLESVLKYGDKVHLQNGYDNWRGGYLDTNGGPAGDPECKANKYGVSTADSPTRGVGSGTWEILSAAGKAVGAEVLTGNDIYLRNLYGDGTYLDTCGGPSGDPDCKKANKYGVSTSPGKDRAAGTGRWRVLAESSSPTDSKVREGDPVHLLNGYNDWNGGYLDTCGSGPAGSKYGVSTSHSTNRAKAGTGTWRFSKAKS